MAVMKSYTHSLWKHYTQPIQFMLVDDDFAIKYVKREDEEHLLSALKDHYKDETDWPV